MTVDPDAPVVYRSGRVFAPGTPEATAVAVSQGRIVAVGTDEDVCRDLSGGRAVDLGGALVTPAFVDAHLHAVQLGLVIDGLDLHGVRSRTELLDRLSGYMRQRPGRGIVVGQGWDERGWPEATPPTREEIDRAAGALPVYLARVDVHSALVSSALLARIPDAAAAVGYREDGLLSQDAHHRARHAVDALVGDDQRREAARLALRRCAEVGVGTVHELGGPDLGPIEDLDRVWDAAAEIGLEVVAYWGEEASAEAFARARRHRARGLAGDLCVDGSIGSRTAALIDPYADGDGRGVRYLGDDQITAHLVACTGAGVQAGFHCIGDDAVAAVVDGLRRTADLVGASAVRAARHRLEHLEMITPDEIATLADLNVAASMQPAFDAAWGGPGELYEQRVGRHRSVGMNPLHSLWRAGATVAYGTDAPVTPPAGWETVRDAVTHWNPDERVPLPVAFDAATRGGHLTARDDDAGTIAPGMRANMAIWNTDDVTWDPCGLPDLAKGAAPTCAGLLVAGRGVVDQGALGLTQ